jgi:hypothetical protein
LQSNHIQYPNISEGPRRIVLAWDHVGWPHQTRKSTVIYNLILHYLFTFILASLLTHLNRYGLGWS